MKLSIFAKPVRSSP